MKKVIVGSVIGISLLLGAVVAAHSIDGYLDRLQERLELSEEQKESLRKIIEESDEKQAALQKQMRALQNETREQFKAVLNEEQLKQLEETRNDRGKGRGKHHRRGKSGHYWGNLKKGHQSFIPEDYGYRLLPRFLDSDSNAAKSDI